MASFDDPGAELSSAGPVNLHDPSNAPDSNVASIISCRFWHSHGDGRVVVVRSVGGGGGEREKCFIVVQQDNWDFINNPLRAKSLRQYQKCAEGEQGLHCSSEIETLIKTATSPCFRAELPPQIDKLITHLLCIQISDSATESGRTTRQSTTPIIE